MEIIKSTSLDEFYQQAAGFTGKNVSELLPPGIHKEIGHFNIFDIAATIEEVKRKNTMPYNRRAYYKISLIRGRNRAEYADKVMEIERNALLFATPKVPYHWIPMDANQSGHFCVFTDEFLVKNKSGVVLDDLPIFQSGGYPVFEIDDETADEIGRVFVKMKKEIASDYSFKYDLLRNYVLELIHCGQKLQPAMALANTQNAATRVASLFVELLERQFPIESPQQQLKLRTAKDYADRLAIHVNYLNRVLKAQTGKTTTEIIASRITQEAKILLKQTDWNVSEIAYSLGFDEIAHFSNFFKKQTDLSPLAFRS
ncbi:helix-turn-helix transcriptional regulator [Parapedobacter sp. ISTM3]|uniref:Helix-turn-helix domain-containing protein n=1 Tax=Parapedobacter luteus TaxID=623280 RepID=A0A1T5AN01_9SPHI|nr:MULTISPECIES: AraC family transcriptional regulator [Parapedobacter]MBK1441902.1 helix-turn-helix transcriptional regulator [Parapedobacter sp. ISTM3]SKB36372.1 Helix-turn-helix domain-containing protein [Parapedobacter luteus]